VRQDEGTVKNDQGTVQFDQLQVDYCHIGAPISGRVGLRQVDPGNLVTAGASSTSNPLVVITQLHPITVIFTIPEDSLGEVQAQLRKNALNGTSSSVADVERTLRFGFGNRFGVTPSPWYLDGRRPDLQPGPNSLLLTLYTTPVLYLAFDRLRLRMQGKKLDVFHHGNKAVPGTDY
jgi:hypothetical protein